MGSTIVWQADQIGFSAVLQKIKKNTLREQQRQNKIYGKSMNKNWFRVVVVIYFCLSVPSSFAAMLHLSPVESTENCVIAGYKVHYGTTSGNYTQVLDVGDATSYDLDLLGLVPTQTYFFSVNAYSTANQDGPLSSPVSYTDSPNIVAYPSIDHGNNTIDVT